MNNKNYILKLTFKLLFLCIIYGLPLSFAKAKGITEKPSKEVLKQLKEKYGISKIKSIISHDGFSYYLGTSKSSNNNKGIVGKDMNVVIPFKYKEISYYPGIKEGVSNVPRYYTLLNEKYPDFLLQHQEVNPAFVGTSSDIVDIYDSKGNLLKSYSSNKYNYLPGYFIIEAKDVDQDCFQDHFLRIDNAKAILTQNGRELATNFSEFKFYLNTPFGTYTKVCNDGVKREGLAHLYNSNFDIPCQYHYISYGKKDGKWYFNVMKNAVANFEPYNPQLTEGNSFKDKGQLLFEQKKYAETIEFHKDSLANSPIYRFIPLFFSRQTANLYSSLLPKYIASPIKP